MKKNLFMVAAVALMAFTACNKEEFNYGAGAPVGSIEFTAGFEAETKTTLVDGKTAWSEGDEISINGVKFTAQQSGLTSTFVNAEVPQGEFKAPFTAIYPYSETAGVAEVAATQTVSSGTFADDVVVSVAYAEDGNNLTFRHVSSVIKFQVATEGVEELVFSSSTADLAGTINVNTDASYIVKSGSKTITVRPSNGTFKTTETYYVSVLPTIGEGKVDFSVKLDKNEAKSGNVSFAKNTIMDAGKFAIMRDLYVCISDVSWTKVNIHLYDSEGDITKWPGDALSEKVEINGKTYYKKSISQNTKLSLVFNDGSTASNWKLEIKDVSLTQDLYYRLSARGPIAIDPNDVSTFGYAIYVFDQKSKNVAPNLYVWNDNGKWQEKYGVKFDGWPGVAFKDDCYYQPANGENWKHYYYYEIPTALYNSTFNYIVNKTGQTSDLTSKTVTSDLYVGYWYDNNTSNGFWTNAQMSTPITQ